jgi:3-deoxy-D-manno-octulosonate 8-phosphate phosphatase (KDO 8-P phosphatase)
MGDDLPDYPMLKRAGVSTCPADAAVEIRDMVDYVSIHPGGHGAVRDVIEQVLRLQGTWFHEDAVVW